jgi:hypothetical protein
VGQRDTRKQAKDGSPNYDGDAPDFPREYKRLFWNKKRYKNMGQGGVPICDDLLENCWMGNEIQLKGLEDFFFPN